MNQDGPSRSRLTMRLFGGYEVEVDGHPLPNLRSQKGLRLLVYFSLKHGRQVRRDTVKELFWPVTDQRLPDAEKSLQTTLTDLRQKLNEPKGHANRIFSPGHGCLQFEPQEGDEIDVIRFDEALDSLDTAGVREAIRLYRGPLLAGWDESWIRDARQERVERYIRTLEQFRNRAMGDKQYEDALVYLRGLMRAELKEGDGWRALMEAYISEGKPEKALEVYKELEEFLKEVNPPSPETRQALGRIGEEQLRLLEDRYDRRFASAIDVLPPSRPLIGREEALGEIQARLTGGHARSLVLTGSPGVGKSHLAVEAGHQVKLHFAHGVKFIDLDPVTSSAEVITHICSILRVPEDPGEQDRLDELVRWLRPKNILLIWNNCERHLDVCRDLALKLLSSCPQLHILATSRRAFEIDGDTWEVPCLDVPPPSLSGAPEDLLQYSAIQLFVACAKKRKRTFALTPANAPKVAEICRRLDGIPLAIELTAARIRTQSPQEMADRNRNAPSLRTSIERSYELLNEGERRLFCRLSVFAAGWTEQAALEVCAGEEVDRTRIPDLLAELVENSLLECSGVLESRYRMLESIREYSRACLVSVEEGNTWRKRHRDYFLGLAEKINRKLGGEEEAQWLDTLQAENANLVKAITLCLENQDDPEEAEKGLRLGAALQQYWWTRGYLREGRKYYDDLLNHPQAQRPTKARADALNGAAVLARMQNDLHRARSLHEEGLEIYRRLGNNWSLAVTLSNLGIVRFQDDPDCARSLFEESLTILQALKHEEGIAIDLGAFVEEGMALCHGNLGMVFYHQPDYAAARWHLEQCLAIYQELRNMSGIAMCLANLGSVAYYQKEYADARSRFTQSLRIYQEIGNKLEIASSLDSFARLACVESDLERAVRLYGASEKLQDELEAPLQRSSVEEEEYRHNLDRVRLGLGEERLTRIRNEGYAMSLEQAIEYACNGSIELTFLFVSNR